MNTNSAPVTAYRVGRRSKGQWRPATKHRNYDDAEIVARGLVLGAEASATRIWRVGAGSPQIVARVSKRSGDQLTVERM